MRQLVASDTKATVPNYLALVVRIAPEIPPMVEPSAGTIVITPIPPTVLYTKIGP